MNGEFDDEQDSSRISDDVPSPDPDLSHQQREIHRNLKYIGEEIAAFYLDGLKILQDDNLQTGAYLLAHIAREIDGGLRDILSSDEVKKNIQQQLTTEVLAKFGDPDELKERRGHIASILAALGIEDVASLLPDDVRLSFAVRWINVSPQFPEFVHRHGAWKFPRAREKVENLWYEFENVLVDLVGSSLNLLNRLDRILEYKEPTSEIRGTLDNLLDAEARRAYFFRELEFSAWLEPLKEDGWFNPDQNPTLQEDPDQPGNFYHPIWHALEYAAKVSAHSGSPIGVLVDIVNSIINYTDDNGDRIENGRTDLQTIKIIEAFPIDRLELQHITFMGVTLKSKWKYGLVDQEIGQTILPKLLNGGERELTLALLTIMLEVESVEPDLRSVMNDYWLEIALKAQAQAIANLCGIEASQIPLEKIRAIAVANRFILDFIERVESDLSLLSHPNYAELMVSFTSSVFRHAKPDNIERTIQSLLQDPIAIIRRIALKAITDHYNDLKHLFWTWQDNPFNDVRLEPEITQLLETYNHTFDEDEMEQILQWIESTQH
jgi:hypothetical protein